MSANMKHTPGPWSSGGTLEVVAGKLGADVPTVAVACCDLPRGLDGYANARLIAAAPELLAALETAYAVMTSARVEVYNHDRANYSRIENAIDAARAAIAKAKGEPAHG